MQYLGVRIIKEMPGSLASGTHCITETQRNADFVINIAGSQSFGSRGCNSKYCNIVRRDNLFGKSMWAICPYHIILIF